MAKGGVDALLIETSNSWEEASLALQATESADTTRRLPIVLSMEGALRDNDLVPQPQLAPVIAHNVLTANTERRERGAGAIEALGFPPRRP